MENTRKNTSEGEERRAEAEDGEEGVLRPWWRMDETNARAVQLPRTARCHAEIPSLWNLPMMAASRRAPLTDRPTTSDGEDNGQSSHASSETCSTTTYGYNRATEKNIG